MGLSIGILCFKTDSVAALDFLEFAGLTGTVFTEAGLLEISKESLNDADVSGWKIVVLDQIELFYELENYSELLAECSQNGAAFLAVMQSSIDGLWFEYYEQGQLMRQWIQAEDEVVSNFGTRLEFEPENFFTDEHQENEIDEWAVLNLLEQVTGVDISAILIA